MAAAAACFLFTSSASKKKNLIYHPFPESTSKQIVLDNAAIMRSN